MNSYAHLCDHAAHLVDADLETKTLAIRTLSFIPYPEGVVVLRWLSFLRRVDAGCDRPHSIHLVGGPNAGKSRLFSHYAGLNPPEERNSAGTRPVPVALVECPSDATPKSLRNIITEQCLPGFCDLSASEVVDALEASGLRQLLIDECGNLLNAGASHQQECLSFLKRITNAGISLAIATTGRWANVLEKDEQLDARFRRIQIHPWAESMELRQFLAAVERQIPLPEPSHLDGMSIVRWLVAHGYISTGPLLDLIRDAAGFAFERNSPRIDVALLEYAAASPVPPDGRG